MSIKNHRLILCGTLWYSVVLCVRRLGQLIGGTVKKQALMNCHKIHFNL